MQYTLVEKIYVVKNYVANVGTRFSKHFFRSYFFLWKNVAATKKIVPGDTSDFSVKLQQFENFVAISWKICSCPLSFRSMTANQDIKRLYEVFTLMKIENYFIGITGLQAGIFLNVFYVG